MTKTEKRQIIGTLLFILAVIQIFNFARRGLYYFPHLVFNNQTILQMILSTLNWPFKFLNYSLVYLLGWTALLTPFFFFALGITFFQKKLTQKVKRQRLILIWTICEISFFMYVINYISFIIVPRSVKAGYIAHIFAAYLKKIGGVAFISLFFLWSLISYFLFLKKTDWRYFWLMCKKILWRFLTFLSHTLTRIFQGKSRRKTQSKAVAIGWFKTNSRTKTVKKIEDRNFSRQSNNPKQPVNNDSNQSKAKSRPIKADITAKEKNVIDVEYKTINIKEFDTTLMQLSFDYFELAVNQEQEIDQDEIENTAQKIEEIMAGSGINLKRSGITVGPRLIRIEYHFPKGIQLKEIEKNQAELSYRLGGIDLDIELPIPGTHQFGIYIGRSQPDQLGLGSYLEQARQQSDQIPILMGVTADGKGYWSDAATFPHLLIGGTTGSGKSVFLNNIIINLMALSLWIPINILLVDPKRVEFSPYQKIKQLAHSIITDVDEARSILIDCEQLMEERYEVITQSGVRNIFEFNQQNRDEENPQPQKMPFLFVIIDEFADLLMQDKSGQIKKSIIRLAQKSRAVGIHVIIATQRPSADIIDGLIKANFPARVAFKTSSRVDSRIVLDENGAENLLGKGDMIIKTSLESKKRLQGIYIGINEIKKVIRQKA